jgi:hypothetical protein
MATVRRVRRIVRKIDPWTTLKVSALVWAVLAVGLVLGMVIFWSVLERAGLPERIAEFMREITLIDEGSDPFANSEQFLRVLVFGGVAWWISMTGLTVAGAIVYNLVSDVVGGLEIVVLEESLNPIVTPATVLSPAADYRVGNGNRAPPLLDADLPTEETPTVEVNQT